MSKSIVYIFVFPCVLQRATLAEKEVTALKEQLTNNKTPSSSPPQDITNNVMTMATPLGNHVESTEDHHHHQHHHHHQQQQHQNKTSVELELSAKEKEVRFFYFFLFSYSYIFLRTDKQYKKRSVLFINTIPSDLPCIKYTYVCRVQGNNFVRTPNTARFTPLLYDSFVFFLVLFFFFIYYTVLH